MVVTKPARASRIESTPVTASANFSAAGTCSTNCGISRMIGGPCLVALASSGRARRSRGFALPSPPFSARPTRSKAPAPAAGAGSNSASVPPTPATWPGLGSAALRARSRLRRSRLRVRLPSEGPASLPIGVTSTGVDAGGSCVTGLLEVAGVDGLACRADAGSAVWFLPPAPVCCGLAVPESLPLPLPLPLFPLGAGSGSDAGTGALTVGGSTGSCGSGGSDLPPPPPPLARPFAFPLPFGTTPGSTTCCPLPFPLPSFASALAIDPPELPARSTTAIVQKTARAASARAANARAPY
jgi:hypothetical protein